MYHSLLNKWNLRSIELVKLYNDFFDILLLKDFMLAELMKSRKEWFVNYHEHDSLLENKIGEELDEEERKAAWEEYDNERKGVIQMRQNFMGKAILFFLY